MDEAREQLDDEMEITSFLQKFIHSRDQNSQELQDISRSSVISDSSSSISKNPSTLSVSKD